MALAWLDAFVEEDLSNKQGCLLQIMSANGVIRGPGVALGRSFSTQDTGITK